jgi:PAS domain S-box-containing protein
MIVEKDILFIAPSTHLAKTRFMLLTDAGYPALWTKTIEEAEELLGNRAFPLLILGKQLTQSEQRGIIEAVRARTAESKIMAIGYEALRGVADAYLPRMSSPDEFLYAVGSLLMQAHGHPEVEGDCVMYVDSERRYTFVSDGVCNLLGYPREHLLGMTIDEITYPETADVATQFQEYRRAGRQQGRFLLRHRTGSPVPVSFNARVLPDGCMVSVLALAELDAKVR